MLRSVLAGILALLLWPGMATADDKEVKGTIVKVDVKGGQIVVKTDDGEKTFDINSETKFMGPKGGVSDAHIKDDRLTKGAEIKLLIAGNNKTAREVHLPLRKTDK